MKTDIRALVEALSHSRALRDRGEGLYLVEKPFADARFRVEEAPSARFRVFPTPALLLQIEENRPAETAFLRQFARFLGQPASDRACLLFSEGVKLLEAPQAGKVDRFSRDVRALAAEALRASAPTGGLYALAVLLEELEEML